MSHHNSNLFLVYSDSQPDNNLAESWILDTYVRLTLHRISPKWITFQRQNCPRVCALIANTEVVWIGRFSLATFLRLVHWKWDRYTSIAQKSLRTILVRIAGRRLTLTFEEFCTLFTYFLFGCNWRQLWYGWMLSRGYASSLSICSLSCHHSPLFILESW